MSVKKAATLALFVFSMFALSACGPSYVQTVDGLKIDEGAEIEETDSTKAVLDVVSGYKAAMIEKDVTSLETLISDDYYENGGTTDRTDDDYGYDGLMTAFKRFAENVKTVKFEVVVKDVRVEGNQAQVFYEYVWNYLYTVGEKPRWESGRNVNRMDLVKNDDGQWKITRGM